jgi:hypothetical protein
MPYPNYHSARIKDPKKYKEVKYGKKPEGFPDGIDVLWGILGPKESEIQAIRFDADKWTAAKAKKWLKDHDYKPIEFEAAKEASHGVILRSEHPPAMAIIAGGSQRFTKELIHVGRFRSPQTGEPFDVTDDMLADWAKTFKAMRANGIKVPIPQTHDTSGNTDNNRGWVEDMVHEGDKLLGVLELHADDPEQLAKVSDVSIYSPPEFVDGEGRTYKRPILHVALCTDPLIPGLGGFQPVTVPLAASGKTEIVNVSIFAEQEEVKKMDLKALQEALGLADELTEENAVETITKLVAALKARVAELEAATKEKPKEEPATTASRTPPEPDPEIVRLAAENRTMKLEGLVAAGRITPAVRDKLKGIFLGPENAALKASLGKGDGAAFDGFVEALKENDPVKLGEQTRGQTLTLQNPHNAAPKIDPELEERKKRARGGKE